MTTKIQDIVEGFTFLYIQYTVVLLTYEIISYVHKNLNANESSVQSSIGGGAHKYLNITIQPPYA